MPTHVASLESLQEWNALQNAFRLVRVQFDALGAWRAELRTTHRTASPDLTLSAQQVVDDDRVVVSFTAPLAPSVTTMMARMAAHRFEVRDAVSAVDRSRSGLVVCAVTMEPGHDSLEITSVIYGDAFSRHALNAAVQEIVKAYLTIDQQLDDLTIAAQLRANVEGDAEHGQPVAGAAPQVAGRCIDCGHENPVSSRYCNQCGTALFHTSP